MDKQTDTTNHHLFSTLGRRAFSVVEPTVWNHRRTVCVTHCSAATVSDNCWKMPPTEFQGIINARVCVWQLECIQKLVTLCEKCLQLMSDRLIGRLAVKRYCLLVTDLHVVSELKYKRECCEWCDKSYICKRLKSAKMSSVWYIRLIYGVRGYQYPSFWTDGTTPSLYRMKR